MLALKVFMTGLLVFGLSSIMIGGGKEYLTSRWMKVMVCVGFYGGLATILVSLLVIIWTM